MAEHSREYRTLIGLVEKIPDPVVITLPDHRILTMNQAALEVLGYEWNEAKTMNMLDFVHPEDHAIVARRRAKIDQGEALPPIEIRYLKRDGSIVIGEAYGLPATIDGQNAQIVVIRDVTARKKVEEAEREFRNELERLVEERTRELQESEARYRDLVEHTPDVVWRMNQKGVLTYLSPGIKAMSGFDPDEFVDLPFEEFRKRFLVGDSDAKAGEMLARRTRREFATEEITYELTCYRKDGSQYTAELHSVPLLNEDGEIVELNGTIRDISERRMVEEELSRVEDQLRQSQKMEAVGQLAGGIAHDFNNLLTVIIGYSDSGLTRLKPGDPLNHNLNEIKAAGERAANLTRQLLAFGRKQILQPRVIDLGEIIVGMEKMVRRLIGEHIEFDVQYDPDLNKIKADPGQIEQVVMNLLVNARDALPRGGNITVSTQNVVLDDQAVAALGDLPIGDYVMLSIADSGVGMGEETLPHIFEPFYTTKGDEEGSGLGLSTVYGIVKQSGGGIEVESEPGDGSTFRVYLPQVEAPEPVAEEKERLASPIEGRETIMVVEDEDMVRELLKYTLERFGYTVLIAGHGGEALLTAERHEGPIDLMITDVVMPQMNGHELAALFAPLRPEMSVLYISGYSEKMIADQLVDPEKPFLQKPFLAKEVAKKIREILDAPVPAR